MINNLKRSDLYPSVNEKKQNKWVKEKEAIKMQHEPLSVSKEKNERRLHQNVP